MAWTGLPPVADTTDISDYNFLHQFELAMVEKMWATGANLAYSPTAAGVGLSMFPRSNKSWWAGYISAITDTTLTDPAGSTQWGGGTDDVSGYTDFIDPWTSLRAVFVPTASQYPTTWWLCIDDNDPNKCIKTKIQSWTNTGTLKFNQIRDYVTSGKIPLLASLVGKRYVIIGYGSPVYWHERLMEMPNDTEYAKGYVYQLKNEFDGTTKLLDSPDPNNQFFRDNSAYWKVDEHKGRDLLVYSTELDPYGNQYLMRVTVKGNTKNTIQYYTISRSIAINSPYIIVSNGKKGVPLAPALQAFAWYRGQREPYASHDALDNTASADMPQGAIVIPQCLSGCVSGVCATCGVTHYAWDDAPEGGEWWSDFPVNDCDSSCGLKPDKLYYGRDVYKTIRAWQLIAENASASYVEMKNYNGLSGNVADPLGAIPLINAAKAYDLAGVNTLNGTTGSVVGASGNDGFCNSQINISGISLSIFPIQVHYCITTYSGTYLWGKGTMLSNTLLADSLGTSVFCQQTDSSGVKIAEGVNGKAIIIALGFTRFVPKTFKRMWDDQCFIADIHTDAFSGVQTAIFPPAPDNFDVTHDPYGVGTYPKRGKSTYYLEGKRESVSRNGPEGFAYEDSTKPFVTNDVARFVGTNYAYSPVEEGVGSFAKNGTDPVQSYYDHFYVGKNSQANQLLIDSQKVGTITSSNMGFIEDTSKDWYNHGWFSGVVYTMTGTATGGSTTTIVDSSKIELTTGTPSNIQACYWAASRWSGDPAYIGFAAEVDTTIGGQTTTESRMVVGSNYLTGTLTVSPPFSSSTTGKVWRIREHHKINRYQGRNIVVYNADGTTKTAAITGNSDTQIFATFTIQPLIGATYRIVDPAVGGVWKWDGSKWIVPTGADAVRSGVTVPKNWHSNQFENQEHCQKRYGRYMNDDLIGTHLFTELKAVYDVLKWTTATVTWASRAVDTVAENNSEIESAIAISGTNITDWEANAQGRCLALWGTGAVEAGVVGPYARARGTDDSSQGCVNYSINRAYAYGQVLNICDRMSSTIEWYDYADNPDSAPTASCPAGVVFSAQGDAVAYQAWTLFSTDGPALHTTIRKKLGSLNIPTGSFCGVASSASVVTGYNVTNQIAIIKWDVSGGMKYITIPPPPPPPPPYSGFSFAGAGALLSFNNF